LDISQSRGGSWSEEIVRFFSSSPFRPTYGNVRISDKDVMDDVKSRNGIPNEWIDQAIIAGNDYTVNEPFKFRITVDENGQTANSTQFFGGEIIVISSSQGGSNLDQMYSMFIDNNIPCYSVGAQTGGYSNTWEYNDEINDKEGRQLCEFMWTIGQTIRPNGEVLEGNPAVPDQVINLNKNNYSTYWSDLIAYSEDKLNSNDFIVEKSKINWFSQLNAISCPWDTKLTSNCYRGYQISLNENQSTCTSTTNSYEWKYKLLKDRNGNSLTVDDSAVTISARQLNVEGVTLNLVNDRLNIDYNPIDGNLVNKTVFELIVESNDGIGFSKSEIISSPVCGSPCSKPLYYPPFNPKLYEKLVILDLLGYSILSYKDSGILRFGNQKVKLPRGKLIDYKFRVKENIDFLNAFQLVKEKFNEKSVELEKKLLMLNNIQINK
jgi:hypothetical protein